MRSPSWSKASHATRLRREGSPALTLSAAEREQSSRAAAAIAPFTKQLFAESAPELSSAIQARYPQDRATYFEPGQLRGVFWLKLRYATNRAPLG
jgi:hypothetical protein